MRADCPTPQTWLKCRRPRPLATRQRLMKWSRRAFWKRLPGSVNSRMTSTAMASSGRVVTRTTSQAGRRAWKPSRSPLTILRPCWPTCRNGTADSSTTSTQRSIVWATRPNRDRTTPLQRSDGSSPALWKTKTRHQASMKLRWSKPRWRRRALIRRTSSTRS